MTRILDRLVPSAALRWGRLTHESDEWLADAVRWQLINVPATIVRPCPAFSRLDELMSAGGKVEADAWVPGQLDGWWRPGGAA